jgi:hypothetical protein
VPIKIAKAMARGPVMLFPHDCLFVGSRYPQTAGRPAQTICLVNRHFREAIDKSRQLDLLAGKG